MWFKIIALEERIVLDAAVGDAVVPDAAEAQDPALNDGGGDLQTQNAQLLSPDILIETENDITYFGQTPVYVNASDTFLGIGGNEPINAIPVPNNDPIDGLTLTILDPLPGDQLILLSSDLISTPGNQIAQITPQTEADYLNLYALEPGFVGKELISSQDVAATNSLELLFPPPFGLGIDERLATTIEFSSSIGLDGELIYDITFTQGGNASSLLQSDVTNVLGRIYYESSVDGLRHVDLAFTDTLGVTTSYSLIGIDFQSPNSPPDAQDDNLVAVEDTSVTFNQSDLLSNDSDPDMDNLSLVIATNPTNGQLIDNLDGTYTYTPNADFNGPDSFMYEISDPDGATSQATVNIDVQPVDDAPFIDVDNVVPENPVPENDAVTIVPDSSGTLLGHNDGNEQLIMDLGLFNPANDIILLDPDFIFGNLADNSSSLSSIRVVNTNPGMGDALDILESDLAALPTGNTTVEFALRAALIAIWSQVSDVDLIENTEMVITETAGMNGEQIFDITFIDVRDNSPTTLPAYFATDVVTRLYFDTQDPTGERILQLTAIDGTGLSSEVNTITIDYPNDPPVAADDNVMTDEDVALNIDVLANDNDPDGDPLTVVLLGQPTHGQAVLNPDNTITYTPNPNYNGPDSFMYEISDPEGAASQATVNIDVQPVDDAPFIDVDNVDPNNPIPENDNVTIETPSSATLLGNIALGYDGPFDELGDLHQRALDMGINNPNHVLIVGDPDFLLFPVGADASLSSFQIINQNPQAGDVLNIIEADLTEFIVPRTLIDTARSVVQTSTLNEISDAALLLDTEVTITATPGANGEVIYDVTFVDVRDNSATTLPIVFASDILSRLYFDTQDPTGSRTLEVRAIDATGLSSEVNTITIDYPNDPPVAADDNVMTDEDVALNIDVLANDNDPNGDPLSVVLLGQPTHGQAVLNPDNTITYTPDPNYNGPDSFMYEISDPEGAASQATVNIDVQPVNDAPEAQDDDVMTDEDTPLNINIADLLANDNDVDGDALAFALVSQPANGQLVDNGDGTLTYTPDPNYNGPDSFIYQVSDPDGDMAQATVNIDVKSVNDGPEANDDVLIVNVGESGAGNVLDNDIDIDLPNDQLTVTLLDGPDHGTLILNPDGTFEYTHNASPNLADSFTYQVEDSEGAIDQATVNVEVIEGSEGPKLKLFGFHKRFYFENQGAKRLSPAVFIYDRDSLNFDGGKLRVEIIENGTANDMLLLKESRHIDVDNAGNVFYRGEHIGMVEGGQNGEALVVTFNANAGAWDVARVISRVAYQNDSDNPSTAMREVQYSVSDGDGGISNVQSKNICFIDINDDPEIMSENDEANAAAGEVLALGEELGLSITDADLDEDGMIQVKLKVRNGVLNFSEVDDLETVIFSDELDSDGSRKIKFMASLEEANLLLSRLTYEANDGFTGTDYLWMKVSDLGGDGLLGGIGRDWEKFEINVC